MNLMYLILVVIFIMVAVCTTSLAQETNNDVRGTVVTKEESALTEVISVKINNALIDFTQYGLQPRIINDRTMVPLRSIFEALGATVKWDNSTKTVTSVRGDITVKLTIGDHEMKKNDTAIALDSPAVIVDSRTLVPVRAVSEAFGCKVLWNDETKTVSIITELYKSLKTVRFDKAEQWNVHNVSDLSFGNSLKGISQNNDANFDSRMDIGIKLDEVRYIKIVANISQNTLIQIFFETVENRGFSEAKCFSFDSGIANNNEYYIDTFVCDGWKTGTLGKIRIDPVSEKGLEFEVFFVEFLG